MRDSSAHRSTIAFAAWSSFAHASVMAAMEVRDSSWHGDVPGMAILAVMGLALLVLAPAKRRQISAATAAGGGAWLGFGRRSAERNALNASVIPSTRARLLTILPQCLTSAALVSATGSRMTAVEMQSASG